jgi:hypothetical protein
MLEIWVRGIQQKIARLDPMFTAYVNHLAANQASQNIQQVNHESILDEDDRADLPVHSNNIIDQLGGIDTQLTQLLTVLDLGEPTPQPAKVETVEKVEKEDTQNTTLGSLLGTLKSVLPVKQMVAMWFQTELITDPESIYYSPNIGPDAWLEHDKKTGPITDIPPV